MSRWFIRQSMLFVLSLAFLSVGALLIIRGYSGAGLLIAIASQVIALGMVYEGLKGGAR